MAKTPSSGTPMRRPDTRQILTVLAVALLVWFALGNWQSVEIHFWVTSSKAPLFIVILVAALLGGFVMWFARKRGSKKGSDE